MSCSKQSYKDQQVYDERIIDNYIPALHTSWLNEGITELTRKTFNIRYCQNSNRIIIPYRSINEYKKYIGIVGRTTCDMYKELGIPKYLAIKPFQKSATLYGFIENYNSIQKTSYVVIFEAEKSVLKRYSRLDGTALALGGHAISKKQIELVLGLNVDIVIAFDKDISIQDVRATCEKLWLYRKTYYIYDKWDLLGDKDSPADLDNQNYKFMLDNKVSYNESEHKKYLSGR